MKQFTQLMMVAAAILLALLVATMLLQEILQWMDHCSRGGIGDGGAYCFHQGGNK